MDFAFSEEQEMLRRSARDFLAKECSPKVVRKLMESSDAYDKADRLRSFEIIAKAV